MAKSFLVPIDLNKNQLQNTRIHNLSSAPSAGAGADYGLIYYDTTTNVMYFWDGTAWKSMLGTIQTINGTAPIVTNTVGSTVTVSINAATGSTPGSMSAAHYTLVNDATSASTPSTLALRNASGQISVADPTSGLHAANKQYVDNAILGIDAKASVRTSTTANIVLSGLLTVDGITLVNGDRVLVKNQTAPAENGVYVAATGSWARASDMDSWDEHRAAYVWVEEGTTQSDTGWLCTVDAGGTLGTTAVTWVQFAGSGTILAGAGLLKTGNTIDIVAANDSLTINADSMQVRVDDSTIETAAGVGIRVKNAGITAAKLATGVADQTTITGGNGTALAVANYTPVATTTIARKKTFSGIALSSTPQDLTHNLNTKFVVVAIQDQSTGEEYEANVTKTNVNYITVSSVTAKTVDVTIIG